MPAAFPSAGDVLTAAEYNLLPRGVMGRASVTATQGSITTVVDLTSLTVTFTAVTGRRYQISAQCELLSSVANDVGTMTITTSGNTIVGRSTHTLGAINTSETYNAECEVTGSGSVTYKLRAFRAAGTGTLSMFASSEAPAFIRVEDIGPS